LHFLELFYGLFCLNLAGVVVVAVGIRTKVKDVRFKRPRSF
jgi:hypothetical protein